MPACDDAICTYWRTKYGVVPYNTWGSLPDRYKAAWDWARPSAGNRTCNQLAGAGGSYVLYLRVHSHRGPLSSGIAWPDAPFPRTGYASGQSASRPRPPFTCKRAVSLVESLANPARHPSLFPSRCACFGRPSRFGRWLADVLPCCCLPWPTDLPTLARRFAPVLKFHKDALGYPMTAQTYFNAGACTCAGCVRFRQFSTPSRLQPKGRAEEPRTP